MSFDIDRIADLSKITITEDRVDFVLNQANEIIKAVEILPDLPNDVPLVDPTNTMELRADVAEPSLPRDVLIGGAPKTAAGCILVPRIRE